MPSAWLSCAQRRRGRNSNSIVEGSLFSSVMEIFVPCLMSLAASASIGIADIYLAGLIGYSEQAAIGMADQLLFLVTMFGAGLATACVAHVSRHKGAGDWNTSVFYARDCLILAIFAGFLASLACWACANPLIALFHCDPHTSELAIKYAVWNAPANAAYIVALCLVGMMRAFGRPRVGLLIWVIMSGLTIALSLLFFFSGVNELRSLEALGIAWDIGSFAGVAIGAIYFVSVETEFRRMLLRDLANSPGRLRVLIYTAFPAVAAELAPVFSNFAIYRILSELSCSAAAQAAWTLRLKFEETFATMPLAALAMAIAVVVGQNIGAGRPDRAKVCAIAGCSFAALAMLVIGTVFSGAAKFVVHGFSSDGPTCALSMALMAPFAFVLPAMALSQVLCGALDGAALTRIPMAINCLGLLIVRCGLTYLLVVGGNQGISGLVEATIVSSVCVAALTIGGFAKHFVFSKA